MSKTFQLRIIGRSNDVYYVMCYENETLRDICNLICNRFDFKQEEIAFKLKNSILSYDNLVKDVVLSMNDEKYLKIVFPSVGMLTEEVAVNESENEKENKHQSENENANTDKQLKEKITSKKSTKKHK